MICWPSERDPVELLADEFASRCRRGESPSVSAYAAEYPEYADQIEKLFPAVAMMEQLRMVEKARHEDAAGRSWPAGPPQRIGDFDIVREIGRGGMGIVYEAEQPSLARRVALKVLPNHVLLLDRHVKRFQREAQTAAKLRHTNIVPVFGVGEQDGLQYYVMPLIRGVGLDEIIRELRGVDGLSAAASACAGIPPSAAGDIGTVVRTLTAEKFATTRPENAQGSPTDAGSPSGGNGRCLRTNHWRWVARIGVQAAEALGYAHAQGTLHRDIKPGNLLIDEELVVCVADFGLARAVDHSDASGSREVVGTPRYMAPEQLRGVADARSDIYALGLTLYELLTLRSAFGDADRGPCLNGWADNPEPVRPRKIHPAIPRDLETILLKCLAPEASKRYQTSTALAADLRRFLEDKPIRARRASWIERTWRWCRRNPATAAASGLAALLLIAVAATVLAGRVQTRRAYHATSEALTRAEANSRLALDVLDDIYVQLSPDRVQISSDSNFGGDACACLGLRSSAGLMPSAARIQMQVQVSEETAVLLENLLVFYDRLAEQASDDFQVTLESAVASRRVADIRQRLGQLEQAETEYARAVLKLKRLDTATKEEVHIRTELARGHNEIGNVRSARLEFGRAYESHRNALGILQAEGDADEPCEDYRYELARTFHFLATKPSHGIGRRPERASLENTTASRRHRHEISEYRESAVSILESLTRDHPEVPDYRLLLALCQRPSELGSEPSTSPASVEGRLRAIQILEELKAEWPDVADFRYELSATHAWYPVGLFPWERRPALSPQAEVSLLKALDESHWLVTHHPTIPHYACSKALILAKLGTVCWRTGRLAEAEDYFQLALQTQQAVLAEFPDLPSHHRVFLEFVRLRLGQVCRDRLLDAPHLSSVEKTRGLLETCVENLSELTSRPELAKDRLAASSLLVAHDLLKQQGDLE